MSAIGRTRFGNVFGRTIALRDDAVIDCLIKWVLWAPAVDIAQPLTAPVSVLEHSWPTFSIYKIDNIGLLLKFKTKNSIRETETSGEHEKCELLGSLYSSDFITDVFEKKSGK